MARIGYSRVSSLDRGLAGQIARLTTEGCTIVQSEKVSGVSRVAAEPIKPRYDQLVTGAEEREHPVTAALRGR